MTEVALPQRTTHALARGGRLSSDERLAQLASRGDPRAFGLLYERYHGALYGYCRSIVRNDEDAKDALQSAVTRALAALQASERDIAVKPWLFRIVHNEAISLLRRRRPEDRPIDERELAHIDVAHAVEERERLAMLVTDIQSLAERQRGALLMRELSGLSIEEIAAALSTTPGTAKQVLFEARCALHELAEGRAMECADVRRTLSERDGRILRGRKLRAHLRACAGCVQFRTLIEARGADLRMLVPPLPAAGALGLLAHAADVGGGHASEVVVSSATFGTPAAVSLVAKGLAGAAIMTAATAGTAHVVRHPAHTAPRHAAAPATLSGATVPALAVQFERTAPRAGATGPPRPARVTGPARHTVAPILRGDETGLTTLSPVAASPAAGGTTQPSPATTSETGSTTGTASGTAGQGAPRANGQSLPSTTPPGLAKTGGVPPGLAQQQSGDPAPPGLARSSSPPQAQGPPTPATPTQPGPPSNPGHSQDPHGNAPQDDAGDGHPGASASHGHS